MPSEVAEALSQPDVCNDSLRALLTQPRPMHRLLVKIRTQRFSAPIGSLLAPQGVLLGASLAILEVPCDSRPEQWPSTGLILEFSEPMPVQLDLGRVTVRPAKKGSVVRVLAPQQRYAFQKIKASQIRIWKWLRSTAMSCWTPMALMLLVKGSAKQQPFRALSSLRHEQTTCLRMLLFCQTVQCLHALAWSRSRILSWPLQSPTLQTGGRTCRTISCPAWAFDAELTTFLHVVPIAFQLQTGQCRGWLRCQLVLAVMRQELASACSYGEPCAPVEL